jgi:hypothetical protein
MRFGTTIIALRGRVVNGDDYPHSANRHPASEDEFCAMMDEYSSSICVCHDSSQRYATLNSQNQNFNFGYFAFDFENLSSNTGRCRIEGIYS